MTAEVDMLDEVRTNKLYISIKFTSENGKIEIKVFYTENGQVTVKISDTGISMHEGTLR